MDEAVLNALCAIDDPEIGVNIVDLGLIYGARRDSDGVAVAMTATSRSCPLGEFLRDEAATRLGAAFRDAPSIDVKLVWTPAWSPARMSEAARRELRP